MKVWFIWIFVQKCIQVDCVRICPTQTLSFLKKKKFPKHAFLAASERIFFAWYFWFLKVPQDCMSLLRFAAGFLLEKKCKEFCYNITLWTQLYGIESNEKWWNIIYMVNELHLQQLMGNYNIRFFNLTFWGYKQVRTVMVVQ